MRISGTLGPERDKQKRWLFAVPSFLVFWIVGLGFLWWLIIPILLFAFRPRGAHSVPRASWILISIGAILALSLAAGVFSGATELRRAPGAVYGALIWISAGLLYATLRAASVREVYQFVRGLIFVTAVQGLMTTLSVVIHPSPLSQFSLPTAGVLGNAGGVAPWTRGSFAFDSWFGEPVVRSSGLQATSAWAGGLACLVLILLVMHRRSFMNLGMSSWWWFVASILSGLSLFYSYTRVSYAILVIVLGYYLVTRLLNRALPGGGLIGGMCFSALIIWSYFYLPWGDFLTEQDALRPGSSEARFASYFEGVSVALEGGPLVFMLGSGAKPFLEELGRGAGSESTYVSLLVRGGILCLVLFIVFLWIRFRDALRSRDSVTIALIVALAIHAIVEDLDVGTFTLILALINFSKVSSVAAASSPTHLEKASY